MNATDILPKPETAEIDPPKKLTLQELQFSQQKLYEVFASYNIDVVAADLLTPGLFALDRVSAEFFKHNELYQPLTEVICHMHRDHTHYKHYVWKAYSMPSMIGAIKITLLGLYQNGLIKSFIYLKKYQQYEIELTDNQELYRFVSGDWLRYFVGRQIQMYLRDHVRDSRSVMFIRNITLQIPDAGLAALDMMIWHSSCWTAVKCCSADNYRLKSANLIMAGKALSIPPERMFLILHDDEDITKVTKELGDTVTIMKISAFNSEIPDLFMDVAQL